jgi:RimJ/RimL family protein N-acetyltransferase
MPHPYWPFFDLRIKTPRLELRYPDDDLMCRLAALAADGIHAPERMPFNEPWTRARRGELEVNALQHWWTRRGRLGPEDWTINFAVLEDGVPVGAQDLFAQQFPVRRSFETGSWLGRAHQGRGIGTEMRAAVLHLGFVGLGADVAETGAFDDNPESRGVTRKLGYEPNGTFVRSREGRAATLQLFRLTRATWLTRRRDDIVIENLDACLPMLDLVDDRRTPGLEQSPDAR